MSLVFPSKMLRSFPRASLSSVSLRGPSIRSSLRPARIPVSVCLSNVHHQQTRQAHAISNPTLAGIEKRWEDMQPQEQADLWMALRDRMKSDWHELTLQEKRAAYWIAFGPHGPRAMDPPGTSWKIAGTVAIAVIASWLVFCLIRSQAKPPPRTMNREWQEASNEYLKRQNAEPITGISSEGYKGKGQIQSKSLKDM